MQPQSARISYPASRIPTVSYSLQMASDAQRASQQPDERAEQDDRAGLLLREKRRLKQVTIEQQICPKGQADRDKTAQQPFDGPLQQEWPPDEAVRRADESHDRDLAAALQDRHANRRADDDDGDHGEGRADDDP